MTPIVVVTGAGAGVGRAVARAFGRHGCDVAVISRDPERLEAVTRELRAMGARALAVPADVADAEAIEAAADQIEDRLGPIDIWVNNAMATVFAPVRDCKPREVRRGTEVTYLGTVHGTMAALRRMRPRKRGTIVNVGSALAYRSVPLQAIYCGAKSAIRGFTDSLRSELIHDGDNIHLTMVHLPAVNTPQFDWALNKTGRRARPVPPIYQPEVAARAIVFAAFSRRREVWVGFSTVLAILANRVAPAFADRYLAKNGYSSQMTDEPLPTDAPANLYEPVSGPYAAHGRFDACARETSWEMAITRHPLVVAVAASLALFTGIGLIARHRRSE